MNDTSASGPADRQASAPAQAPNRANRLRREPPRFRQVEVSETRKLSPWLTRVTLAGPELEGLAVDEPAASVRVLLPVASRDGLVMPTWNGNEFLMPDGSRPPIRTLTPHPRAAESLELQVDVVLHEGGAVSTWAANAGPGTPAAVSGPGRGYTVDTGAPAYLLAGDETALPAISQILDALPPNIPVDVHLELAHPDARVDLPDHPGATVHWHDLPEGAAPGDAMVAAVQHADFRSDQVRIWAAGEAAAVQRIRRHLADEREIPRSQTTVRGYWKHGRTGT